MEQKRRSLKGRRKRRRRRRRRRRKRRRRRYSPAENPYCWKPCRYDPWSSAWY